MDQGVKVALNLNVEVVPTALSEERFVTEGRFVVKARAKVEGSTPFAELELRMGAVYRHGSPLPAPEVLEAFAKTNSMVHLWPYLRAFVQQSSAQLGLPPIMLPPFRVQPISLGEPAREPPASEQA